MSHFSGDVGGEVQASLAAHLLTNAATSAKLTRVM